MQRGISDNAQLGVNSPRVVASCLAQGLPDPLSKGHPLASGNTLNLLVFFLVQENLQSLRHRNSLIDSCNMSHQRSSAASRVCSRKASP